MNKYRIFIAILGGCFVMNASVSAKIYQCEFDGKKVFQDHLCEAVESQQEVAVVENIKSEFTEQERRLINTNQYKNLIYSARFRQTNSRPANSK
ncbi:hypothetical protein [Shewanella waksmanii]|uniref:hypothetical protein n=1 Tax=Shewanella waksmanii TaxID=213783 RepID=UPI00048B72EC|nr:hypothetical protein [Shewanella waksmanii]